MKMIILLGLGLTALTTLNTAAQNSSCHCNYRLKQAEKKIAQTEHKTCTGDLVAPANATSGCVNNALAKALGKCDGYDVSESMKSLISSVVIISDKIVCTVALIGTRITYKELSLKEILQSECERLDACNDKFVSEDNLECSNNIVSKIESKCDSLE